MTYLRETIYLQGTAVEVVHSRRRKKTISLQITDGKAKALVPYGVDRQVLNRFLTAKSSWLAEKMRECLPMHENGRAPGSCYQEGDSFLFLGIPYPLKIQQHARQKSTTGLHQGHLQVTHAPHASATQAEKSIKKNLHAWYRAMALEIIATKVRTVSQQLDLTPSAIKIKSYKRRWGQCGSDGCVSFNWRLVMARESAIHYVVIHELCHLRHMNHSPRFWQLVASAFPSYQEEQNYLRTMQHQILNALEA